MERMTLREAAQRTARSITTLRRYIRSGRLRAEKRFGRFGPEYYLSEQALREAGLDVERSAAQLPVRTQAARPPAASPASVAVVPMSLYQELQMKHEQLLVQYGMVRAAGIRSLELQDRLARAEERLARSGQAEAGERRRHSDRNERLAKQLREANLELEGRALEIVALKEKVRGLEMLTRNAVTNETIERQFSEIVDQSRRVERLRSSGSGVGERRRPPAPADDA